MARSKRDDEIAVLAESELQIPMTVDEMKEELLSILPDSNGGSVRVAVQIGDSVMALPVESFFRFLVNRGLNANLVLSFLKTIDLKSRTVLRIGRDIKVGVDVV